MSPISSACLTLVLLRVTIQTMRLSIAIVVLGCIVGEKLLLGVCARRFDSVIFQTDTWKQRDVFASHGQISCLKIRRDQATVNLVSS